MPPELRSRVSDAVGSIAVCGLVSEAEDSKLVEGALNSGISGQRHGRPFPYSEASTAQSDMFGEESSS